jgi:hypothetical protein
MGAFVYRLEHERERACASACGPASGRRNPPGAPCGMGAQAPKSCQGRRSLVAAGFLCVQRTRSPLT